MLPALNLITLAATAALMFQPAHGLPSGELEGRQARICGTANNKIYRLVKPSEACPPPPAAKCNQYENMSGTPVWTPWNRMLAPDGQDFACIGSLGTWQYVFPRLITMRTSDV
ncbi:hypothetical protein CTA1_9441 [Colletotrichum tanaceti]|uniref:Uncharacterized protein n=1 Tax=Colletotrichum tanaceti TaxID=1306861 RepID=A0A4U6WZX3_9PEZI|nr:hypothetical protein CTA1_9441 [Colletotrichum tanaceti]